MTSGNLDIPDSGGFARTPAKVVADPAWRRREKPRTRWVFWLLGLVGLSLVGSGAMLLLGTEPRQPAEAPLITADPNPVRVRPDDPGGLRVANLDKAVYDQMNRGGQGQGQGQGTAQRPGARVESLLPPPEAPKPLPVERVALTPGPSPQQLAREPEQPAAPPPLAPLAAPPAAPAPSAATPGAAAGPAAAAPQRPAAAPAPTTQAPVAQAPAAAAPPPAAPAPPGTGRIQVQLAAVPSEQAATAEWERLRRRMPDLLANQRLTVSRGEREGQAFFRIRTGAFADNAAARAFCDQVRQRGGSCFVSPAG